MNNTGVREKISYLCGLLDGMNIADEQQKKVYAAMVDALETIAEALDMQADAIEDIDESIVDIYDVLDEVEDALDDEFSFDDDDFLETTCPKCGEVIFFDSDMIADTDMICPSCNEKIDLLAALDDEVDD